MERITLKDIDLSVNYLNELTGKEFYHSKRGDWYVLGERKNYDCGAFKTKRELYRAIRMTIDVIRYSQKEN